MMIILISFVQWTMEVVQLQTVGGLTGYELMYSIIWFWIRLTRTIIYITTFKLHSIIISKPFFLNKDCNCFLIFFCGWSIYIFEYGQSVVFIWAKFFFLIKYSIQMSIGSNTFAASYGPILTSKLSPSLFTQGSPSLYKTDRFRARNITSMFSL